MHVYVFNVCLLVGWLLVLVGGVLINPGAGLAVAGVLLVVLALITARIAGGLYVPARKEDA
jgi:hypothetical protein